MFVSFLLEQRGSLDWEAYEHHEVLQDFLHEAYDIREGFALRTPSRIRRVASYNIRSYTITARNFTRSRSRLGDIAVVVSFHREGAKHFFPAIIDELVEFRCAKKIHRLARVIPYSDCNEAKKQQKRMEKIHSPANIVTDPLRYVRCTRRHMPTIADTKPIFVAVNRIFGLLISMSVYGLDHKSKLIPNLALVAGYYPWYRPGLTGCERGKLTLWDPKKHDKSWLM